MTSTAPRVQHRPQQLRSSDAISNPPTAEKTAATAETANAPVMFDAKIDSNWRLAMLEDLNNRRGQDGLPPLVMSNTLNEMSQNHSNYQVSIKTMTHDDASGPLGQRATDAGIKWSRLAENVAMGAETVDNVMSQWEHSPHHLENILGAYTIVGFGLATDGEGTKGTTYWTQSFAYPL
ncbi:hypothetical protein FBU31_000397 [Coemansia sp. 'formosensis']|nr:hypothetical protein FBU31_000397 [Coemansia sp. 'formosensis']